MTATATLKQRDFDSYLLEYQLMSTEVEINAYWKRMDEIIANMSIEEKNSFFAQMEASLKKEIEESKGERQRIASMLPKTEEFQALRNTLNK
jgi:benzoyl-CoA reductase/2-hydroxyglutaryl-CoA dehydratase subunit BcrC/BadD/HgdB